MVDILQVIEEDRRSRGKKNKNKNIGSTSFGDSIRNRLGFGGPTKDSTQRVGGATTSRTQGGQGGQGGTASDGILLGGNNQQQIIDNSQETIQSSPDDTGNSQTINQLTRLGSSSSSGNTTTSFRDGSGTASITSSPAAAQRLASGAGTTSTLDFSGARNVAPGASAELAALQRGQRLGLDPRATLSLAEDARISALPPGPEKEIALITKQRDDGQLHPAVAQARLNQLFQRQTQADTLTQKSQDAETKAQIDQQEIQASQFAEQQRLQIAGIKDANKSATAANRAKLNLFKFARTNSVDTESPEFKNQVASIGIASVSGELETIRETIRSGQSSPESIRSEVTKLRTKLKNSGFENVTEEQFKQALIEELNQ